MGTGVGEAVFYAIASKIIADETAPKMPKVPQKMAEIAPEIKEMPDPLAQDDAKRKAILARMQQSGRASTILTDDVSGGKLGG